MVWHCIVWCGIVLYGVVSVPLQVIKVAEFAIDYEDNALTSNMMFSIN